MAYIPTEWETGDIITAAKLNKAEEGISFSTPVLVDLSLTDSGMSIAASYNDLMGYMGRLVYGVFNAQEDPSSAVLQYYMLLGLSVEDGSYKADFISFTLNGQGARTSDIFTFSAATATENMVLTY